MKIAILSSVFGKEYGVAKVISSQLPYFVKNGFKVDLYVCELDKSLLIPGVRAVRIPTHFRGLKKALSWGHYDVVIAHTDPFYRLLSEYQLPCVTIGYEHGNPPAELCGENEREERARELLEKPLLIYSKISQVVTISEYAKEYLKWQNAIVIYNGANHYKMDLSKVLCDGNKIRILSVCRFSQNEWTYKGLEDFCRLRKDLNENYELIVVGKGDQETTKRLQQLGITVYSDLSAEKLSSVYSRVDALVSFSKWELFNLPLAEAGFAHKPAIAFNICAHSEVTPFVFDTYEDVLKYFKNSTKESLKLDGEKMFKYVDERFRWEYNGKKLMTLIQRLCPYEKKNRPSLKLWWIWSFWKAREFLRQRLYKKLMRK